MFQRRYKSAGRAAAALLLGCGSLAAQSQAQWRFDAAAGLGYDSNPANAEAGSTLPATGYASSAVSASLTLRPSPRCALLLRGAFDGQQYFDYVGLSNARESGLVRMFLRPVDGFHAPTLAAWGQLAAQQFGSRMRGGTEYRGGLWLSEQLNTAFRLRAGGYAGERDSSSPVFDGRQQAATLDLDWLIGSAATAYAGYEFRYGDFAESSPTDPAAAAFARAMAADDSLFSGGMPEVAYRLRGHLQAGTLGLNVPLNGWLALDAQGRQFHARAVSGDHYNRWLAEFNLLARF
ncbi:MAG: hypothetical protein ISP90_05110 [Nevskia sp.]|nr:hypothetical protein [Nevskia sp.]